MGLSTLRAPRFRRSGLTEGVYYAGEEPHTAVAEIVFYRLTVFCRVHQIRLGLPTPPSTPPFSTAYATKKGIDLAKGKLQKDKALWIHLTDYVPCQALKATQARAAWIENYSLHVSAVDPEQRVNLALLTCRAFTKAKPVSQQTWHIRLSDAGAQAICEAPKSGMTFGRDTFAADPRIAKLRWKRP